MTYAAPTEPRQFAVDPDALRSALSSLDDVALAMTHTRARLREVLAEASVWAADGDLKGAVGALVDALTLNAERAETEAAGLAGALGLAALRYGDAEQRAVYRTRSGDAPAPAGR